MSRGLFFGSGLFLRITTGLTERNTLSRRLNLAQLQCCAQSVFNRVDWNQYDSRESLAVRRSSFDVGQGRVEAKLTLFQRFKAMYRDYWYVLLPVHVVTSCGWFGGFFYLAKSGVDVAAFAQTLHFSESLVEKLRSGGHNTTGYLAITYALYKIATPLRYTVTLGGTTLSINYLKKWGYIKPIPKREELKKIFNDKRDSFIERKSNMAHNLAEAKIKLTERKILLDPSKKKKDTLSQTVFPPVKPSTTGKPMDDKK